MNFAAYQTTEQRQQVSGKPDEATGLEILQTRHLQAQDREQRRSEREELRFLALFEFRGVWRAAFEHTWRDAQAQEMTTRRQKERIHPTTDKGYWWTRD